MACSSISEIPVLSSEDPVWESLSRDYRWDALGTVPDDVSIETLLAYATTDGDMSLEDFVRGRREEGEGLQVDYTAALGGINVMSPAMFADIPLDFVSDLLDLDLLQSGQSNVVADLFKDFDMTSPTALEDLENLLANRRKFRFGTAIFSVNRDHRGCHVSVRGSKTNTEIQLGEREALDLLQLLVTDYCLGKPTWLSSNRSSNASIYWNLAIHRLCMLVPLCIATESMMPATVVACYASSA